MGAPKTTGSTWFTAELSDAMDVTPVAAAPIAATTAAAVATDFMVNVPPRLARLMAVV
ncbi:hypothetical protein I546_1614 [Mycobacterium kansasii 732]|nr:hypothetical protein I546_1614 [Mycobacterium kansasii 732]